MLSFLRLALIAVFAVLLPLRGVVAAASWCSTGHHNVMVATEDAGTEGHAHRLPALPAAAGTDEVHDHHHATSCHEGPADPGRCSGCSATCCASALWHEMPQVPASQATGHAEFPAVTVPLASHPCGGLERPPRRA